MMKFSNQFDLEKAYEDKCKQLEDAMAQIELYKIKVKTDIESVHKKQEAFGILKDLLETKEDLQTWRDEMYSTIIEVINGID